MYADLRRQKPPFVDAKLLYRILILIIVIIIIIINDYIDRLYVKRKEGGRGLVQIEAAYKAEIILQNTLTQIIKKTSLKILLKAKKALSQM